MNVACANRFVYDNETTDGELFTDLEGLILENGVNGIIGTGELAGEKCVYISRLIGKNGFKHALNESLEGIVFRDEVGFGVDFDHSVSAVLSEDIDNTLCGDSACFLFCNGKTFFA